MLYKEWLYTRRNLRSALLTITTPAVLVSVAVLAPLDQQLRESLVFYTFYFPLTFNTIFRGSERVRIDAELGTGIIYLRTQSRVEYQIGSKWLLEFGLVSLALVGPTAVAVVALDTHVSAAGYTHLALSCAVMTALTLALSCIFMTRDSYVAAAMFLSVPPLFVQPIVAHANQAAAVAIGVLVPPVSVFNGITLMATGGEPPIVSAFTMVINIAVVMTLAPRAYRWMLLRGVR